jgi:hypothetical protein
MTTKITAGNLSELWAEHTKDEFVKRDTEATLATMTDDAYVNHVPVLTGGCGKPELRTFYCFAITGAGYPWRHSRPCSVWAAAANHPPITRYVVRPTFLRSPPRINHNLLGVAETTG